jgi:hypothetical protein
MLKDKALELERRLELVRPMTIGEAREKIKNRLEENKQSAIKPILLYLLVVILGLIFFLSVAWQKAEAQTFRRDVFVMSNSVSLLILITSKLCFLVDKQSMLTISANKLRIV